MKLHYTLVEELVQIYTTYGGWRDEVRLKEALAKLDLSVYEQKTQGGTQVLVSTKSLQKESGKTD